MAWSSSTSKLYASSGDIFSQRKSKAHIAMDIFTVIKKTLIKEYVQAVSNLHVLMIPHYLIFQFAFFAEVCHKLMTLF